MSNKLYVIQFNFHYSIPKMRWYSSCTYVGKDVGEGRTDRSTTGSSGRKNHGALATIMELSAMEESHHSHVAQC
jgi:hypothetical protein